MISPNSLSPLNFEHVAAEFVRVLRGRRSQPAFSRRLGYRSNVVYRWEAGRAWPTAASAMAAAERAGIDVNAAVAKFLGSHPPSVPQIATPEGVVQLLTTLRGRTPIGGIAERAGKNRFAVSRWLAGTAEPRLPDFLRMVEATSQRMLDFVAVLVDPAKLPSLAAPWATLQLARDSAYSKPWSHAVLRALELESYRSLPKHVEGFIAKTLGIPEAEERECLELLAKTGQIRRHQGRWVVDETRLVDTRRDAERSRQLKDVWMRVAQERASTSGAFNSSYNLFSASREDIAKISALYRAFFQQVRTIVASSTPDEQVALLTFQFVPLSE